MDLNLIISHSSPVNVKNPNPTQTNESLTSIKDDCNRLQASYESLTDYLTSPPASAEPSHGMQDSTRLVYHNLNPTQPKESYNLPAFNESFGILDLKAPPAAVKSSRGMNESIFTCRNCYKDFQSQRQLSRHSIKHNDPNKFRCTIAGCKKTAYRRDAIRCHIKVHEKRIKAQHEFINSLQTSSVN
jgi:hypothetical protein